ncbi:MAG: PepSY domain-containing protein [Thiobacillus sp.]
MQRTTKIISALTIVTALGTGAAIAANKASGYKLPDEVKSASIKVPENTESQADFAKLARVSQREAEAAALAVQPGQVVQAKLDDEEGYLVWQIDVKHGKGTTEIAVDAGNSKVLAAEAEEDDGNERDGHEEQNERG